MYYTMTSDPADDHGIDYDALAARVQHSADALAQQAEVSRSVPTLAGRRKSQDADYTEGCMPDPTTEGDF